MAAGAFGRAKNYGETVKMKDDRYLIILKIREMYVMVGLRNTI